MGITLRDRGARGWYVRIYRDGKESQRRVADPGPENQAEAEAVLAALLEQEARCAIWTDPDETKPLPIDQLVRSWLDTHGPLRSERTRATDAGLVEWLCGYFGALDLRELSEDHLHGFAAHVMDEKGRSGWTVENALSILRRVISLAVERRLIPASPVSRIGKIGKAAKERKQTEVSRTDAWTPAEVAKILELASGNRALHTLLAVAFHTGCRRGEALALRWEDIDWSRQRIHFRRAARLGGGTKVPKTGRDRYTPLSGELAGILQAEARRQRTARLKGLPAPEWVCCSPQGKFWQERNASRAWQRLQERFAAKGVRPLKLHTTRATFITWALEAGRSPKTVSAWCGVSVGTIYTHYLHAMGSGHDDLEFLSDDGGRHTEAIPEREPAEIEESCEEQEPRAVQSQSVDPDDVAAEFFDWVDKRILAPCWAWIGTTDRGGYGAIQIDGTRFRAHRLSWMIHHGAIPDDQPVVRHHCDNPWCVNPEHLAVGTQAENIADRERRGRSKGMPVRKGGKWTGYLHKGGVHTFAGRGESQ